MGTSGPRDFLCPTGTFNNRTNLWEIGQCTPCTTGSACTTTGLEEPDAECAPGHWCGRGAVTVTPIDNTTGGLCDAGYVCTGGSSTPRPRNGPGTPGAPSAAFRNESGGYLCPLGFECDRGTTRETGCPPTTYNPIGGLDECLLCPAGRTCPGGNVLPEECPLLYFCANGSTTGEPCPDGFYGAEINLQTAGECTPCPNGMYCTNGNITGECAPGYFCGLGNPTPEPDSSNLPDSGPCPIGRFCPSGTVNPLACPAGTVRSQ